MFLLLHVLMVMLGLAGIIFAFWAVHYRSGWMAKAGAVLAPVGLLLALTGVLLLSVPDFFSACALW